MSLELIENIHKCDPYILNRKDACILKKKNGYVLTDAINIARQKGCLLVTETYPNQSNKGSFYIKCKNTKYTKDDVQQILIDFKNDRQRSTSYVIIQDEEQEQEDDSRFITMSSQYDILFS